LLCDLRVGKPLAQELGYLESLRESPDLTDRGDIFQKSVDIVNGLK
jgi:hypothetical protein